MQIAATSRNLQGTGASRRLRNAGKTPGIIYGGEAAPQLIELDHNSLWYALQKEAFHASILDLEIAGKTNKVLLRDVQYHPYKPLVLHIDFQRVSAKEKISIKVPVHFTGAELSDAVKLERCLVNHILNEIEVSCLPADLPEFIEVDLSKVTRGQTIHVSQIALPKGVTAVIHGAEDPVVVTVSAPKGGVDSGTGEATDTTAEDKKAE